MSNIHRVVLSFQRIFVLKGASLRLLKRKLRHVYLFSMIMNFFLQNSETKLRNTGGATLTSKHFGSVLDAPRAFYSVLIISLSRDSPTIPNPFSPLFTRGNRRDFFWSHKDFLDVSPHGESTLMHNKPFCFEIYYQSNDAPIPIVRISAEQVRGLPSTLVIKYILGIIILPRLVPTCPVRKGCCHESYFSHFLNIFPGYLSTQRGA